MLLLKCLIISVYMNGFSSKSVSSKPWVTPTGTPKRTLGSTPITSTRAPKPALKFAWCGEDKLPNKTIQEGLGLIESFPWLGLLLYPIDSANPTTTTVVLVTQQFALSTALDIDYYPKADFRARSRVIFGNNCSGPYISIRDYTFHPDFTRTTYSSLAVIQLDIKRMKRIKLSPICRPPDAFLNGDGIYALNLVYDCYNSSMVMVYKMEYVDMTQCHDFYRRIGLDLASMWPTHLVCAQGLTGGHCIWRSGTALVMRYHGQWRLLGLGIYGPGCQTVSRFLDYGMYRVWLKRFVGRIGQPTISRLASNHIVLRRTIINLPRFGACDAEERSLQIYTTKTTIVPPPAVTYEELGQSVVVSYSLILAEHVDYRCVTLKARYELRAPGSPIITLRHGCADPRARCTATNQTLFIMVSIIINHTASFKVNTYGTEIKYYEIDYDSEEYVNN